MILETLIHFVPMECILIVSDTFKYIQIFLVLQRMNFKMSEMKNKIHNGQCPLPLFTCLHVKPDVSELMFAGRCFLLGHYTVSESTTVGYV